MLFDFTGYTPRQIVDLIPPEPIPIVERILAEKSLKHFIMQAWHIVEPKNPLVWNWHLDVIVQHLEAMTNTYLIKSGFAGSDADGIVYDADNSIPAINYLLINIPPRHTKSLIAGVLWPCWEWGPKNLPALRYIFTSYAQSLTTRDSLKRRRIIESKWYQQRWGDRFCLTTDQNAKTRFDNDRTGFMMATSILGQAMGEGGDRIIADDPNNTTEIESDVKCARTIDIWDDTYSSRVNDDTVGGYVVVQQRTGPKDISGHLLEKKQNGEIPNLVHICLPARYEKNHPHPTNTPLNFKDPRTEEGEPLDKNRWGEEKLKLREGRLTKWAQAGQFQQRPRPRGGLLMQTSKIRIVENYNHRMVSRMVRYWDKAASTDRSSSHTVGLLMALMKDEFDDYGILILDVVSGQWEYAQRDKIMRQTAEMDGIEVHHVVEQEGGSGGKESALNSIRKVFFGFKCSADHPSGAKEVRLEPFAGQVDNDNVAMIRAGWNRDYISALADCAPGNVTDFGDASSGAFNWLSGLTGKGKAKARIRMI